MMRTLVALFAVPDDEMQLWRAAHALKSRIGVTTGEITADESLDPMLLAGGGLLEFSTVWDGDLLGRPPRPGTQSLHFLDNIHSVLHAAKDNVPTIQPKWTEEINIPPK